MIQTRLLRNKDHSFFVCMYVYMYVCKSSVMIQTRLLRNKDHTFFACMYVYMYVCKSSVMLQTRVLRKTILSLYTYTTFPQSQQQIQDTTKINVCTSHTCTLIFIMIDFFFSKKRKYSGTQRCRKISNRCISVAGSNVEFFFQAKKKQSL